MQMMPRRRPNSDPEPAIAVGCRAWCSWAAFQPSLDAEGPLQHHVRL